MWLITKNFTFYNDNVLYNLNGFDFIVYMESSVLMTVIIFLGNTETESKVKEDIQPHKIIQAIL